MPTKPPLTRPTFVSQDLREPLTSFVVRAQSAAIKAAGSLNLRLSESLPSEARIDMTQEGVIELRSKVSLAGTDRIENDRLRVIDACNLAAKTKRQVHVFAHNDHAPIEVTPDMTEDEAILLFDNLRHGISVSTR